MNQSPFQAFGVPVSRASFNNQHSPSTKNYINIGIALVLIAGVFYFIQRNSKNFGKQDQKSEE